MVFHLPPVHAREYPVIKSLVFVTASGTTHPDRNVVFQIETGSAEMKSHSLRMLLRLDFAGIWCTTCNKQERESDPYFADAAGSN